MPYYSDTHPRVEKLQFDLMRRVSVSKKLMMVSDLNRAVIEMAWSALCKQYPHKNKSYLRRRLADRILGKELAEKAYGPLFQVMFSVYHRNTA